MSLLVKDKVIALLNEQLNGKLLQETFFKLALDEFQRADLETLQALQKGRDIPCIRRTGF
jgi:hypothetical protein